MPDVQVPGFSQSVLKRCGKLRVKLLSTVGCPEQPLGLTGFDRHFCSILHPELFHYIVQMDLNRAFADLQLMSDNFVGLALPDSIHDGALLLS